MVIWTDKAKENLRNIFLFISKDSKEYAGFFVKKIFDLCSETEHNTSRKPLSNILPFEMDVFYMSYQSYLVLYQINAENLIVLTVVDSPGLYTMRPPRILKRNILELYQ